MSNSDAQHRARGSRGVDLAAPVGSAVTPIAAGRVSAVSSDPRSGNFIVIDHGDGLTSSYSHLGRQDVKVGDAVSGSTPLGAIGMTGRTSGPHLHLRTKRNGVDVDPITLMGSPASGGQSIPQWDKAAAYGNIDKMPGLSFEQREQAKQWVDREFSRKDSADAREEREAEVAAKEVILRLGERFTSLNQLPQAVRGRMSPDAAISSLTSPRATPSPGLCLPMGRILQVSCCRPSTPHVFLRKRGSVTLPEKYRVRK